jgi:hypothetical protein
MVSPYNNVFYNGETDPLYRLTQFAITKALPYIFKSFGYGTWFFFACWMITATVWAFFFLPETKGKTLEEMDIMFGYVHDRAPSQHDDMAKAGAQASVAEHKEDSV